jgi:hypothetical protein
MHNGGPFEVRGSIARRLAERDGVDRLMAPGNEARVAVVVVVAMAVGHFWRPSLNRTPAGGLSPTGARRLAALGVIVRRSRML